MQEQIEKQAIEEMAKVIEITEQIARDAHCGLPSPRMYAKDLYWHGYRKQKVGEWLPTCDIHPLVNKYKCSCCGEENMRGNFCPNCGAHMRGDKNE